MSRPLTIALVAGEASGDQLGGALIKALRELYPGARFCGVGGRYMREAGFETWWDREALSVMGLFEVVRHLPRLLKLRKALRAKLLAERPDVLVGIDAPDFNLGLEKQMKRTGMPTVHYVSPTVWAWRSGRAAKIGQAADLVLCLFPFEPAFYKDFGVQARYTGHPMADMIHSPPDQISAQKAAARQTLSLPENSPLLALLPGSRGSEVSRLAQPQLEAASQLARQNPELQFVAALADERTADLFREALAAHPSLNCTLVVGAALDVMRAADVVVCASGTASLECLLVNRPMVVVYKLAATTHWLAATLKLVKSRFISLPNILAGEPLVPELIQDQANGPAIAHAVQQWFADPQACARLQARFTALHEDLRRDAAASAAQAIADLIEARRASADAPHG
jgi:lipid-A-disaccharide synthase